MNSTAINWTFGAAPQQNAITIAEQHARNLIADSSNIAAYEAAIVDAFADPQVLYELLRHLALLGHSFANAAVVALDHGLDLSMTASPAEVDNALTLASTVIANTARTPRLRAV